MKANFRRPTGPFWPSVTAHNMSPERTSLAWSENTYQALLREVRESRTVATGAILLMELLSKRLSNAIATGNMAVVAAETARIGSDTPVLVAALLENV